MLDNHSAAQRESLKWLKGDVVEKKMYSFLITSLKIALIMKRWLQLLGR